MRVFLAAIVCVTFGICILTWQSASADELSATASVNPGSLPIFDGKTLNGWTTTDGKPVTKGWEVVDGAIHLNLADGRGGNIVTAKEYVNFDFRFEWKISPGGNSGIKYRVRNYGRRTMGCEYQIIDDDKASDGNKPKSSTGAMYDLYPPGSNKYLNPIGEFNSSRIVISGNRVQHWLNGNLILSVCIGSCDWFQKKAQSKFRCVCGFSENRYGKIMLTDHYSEVWYRNIELHELPEAESRARYVDRSARFRRLSSSGRGRLSRRCR
jgi:3-keto-disaccharide hydrolase